jgi:hypothetical protein
MQAGARWPEAEPTGQTFVEHVKVVVLELDDPSAIHANEVVVVGPGKEIRIVVGLIASEFDLAQKACLHQHGDRAVDRRPRGAGVERERTIPQFIGGEMFVAGKSGRDDVSRWSVRRIPSRR